MKKLLLSAVLTLLALLLAQPTWADPEQTEPIVPKEKISLFNGSDFAGWKLFVEDPDFDVSKNWKVKDGLIQCGGRPNGYMRTEKSYANYLLHVEWRWAQKPGNSGVLVHMSGEDNVWPKSIECQLMAENAGDFWVIGGTELKQHADGGDRVNGRNVKKLKAHSENEPGQWNCYDIICKDDWIVVLVNGVLQNVATSCNVKSGKICLQSEGTPIVFRNVYIEPLE